MSSDDGAIWVGWRTGVFGDPYTFWHDGPDFHRLLAAATDDVLAVERMLTLGIAQADPLAAAAFSALAAAGRAPDGAVALLRAAVPTAAGTFLVRVAQALRALTGDESCADLVASVLTAHPAWYDRMDAAIALADFAPTPALVAALTRATDDADGLVRGHAAESLRRMSTS